MIQRPDPQRQEHLAPTTTGRELWIHLKLFVSLQMPGSSRRIHLSSTSTAAKKVGCWDQQLYLPITKQPARLSLALSYVDLPSSPSVYAKLIVQNQDMTGYSPSGRVAVYTDYGDSSFIAYVRRVVLQYTGLASTSDKCGYGCGDHASAYSNGFRECR